MKNILTITLILFSYLSTQAQKPNFKFGKLTKEEFNIEKCEFYPEAQSMILSEFGDIKIIYEDGDKRWNYIFNSVVRKKIFDKADKDAGSVSIRIYSPAEGRLEESVNGLKGQTYNLVDGKLTKIKLDKSAIYETRVNDYWVDVQFTFPEVQVGSVIEYSYNIKSDFINNLRTWEFQKDIPVARSEFNFTLPEYFNYQISQEGTPLKLEVTDKPVKETFFYTYQTLAPGGGGFSERVKSSLESESTWKKLVTTNLLPVPDEPYMSNRVNVPGRVEFQLSSIQMPQQPIETIASSYENMNKELMESSLFGKRLEDNRFAKDFVSALEGETDLDKASKIYSWIQGNFSWNGYVGFRSSDAGKKAFDEKTGDVADINLTFIAACKAAGINSKPVILSTRGNGIVHPLYPSYDRFNYVIALTEVDGKQYFLDPSSSLPFGEIPMKCRNGNGRIVSPGHGDWIDLKTNSNSYVTTLIEMNITSDKTTCNISSKEEGYGAYSSRTKYEKDGEESFFQDVADGADEWEYVESSVETMDWNEPIKYNYSLEKSVADEDIIYISPIMVGGELENPFKQEERVSIIDFPFKQKKTVISKINFPEGYTVELPEPLSIKLPDNLGSFLYNPSSIGQTIQIMSQFRLNQTNFTPEQYASLKNFYEIMVEKNNEIIVLKKG